MVVFVSGIGQACETMAPLRTSTTLRFALLLTLVLVSCGKPATPAAPAKPSNKASKDIDDLLKSFK